MHPRFQCSLLLLAVLTGCPAGSKSPCDWSQSGGDSAHRNQSCAEAQPLARALGRITVDPFIEEALDEGNGALLAHYPGPLLIGDDVYMLEKGGTHRVCDGDNTPGLPPCGVSAWETQTYSQVHYQWSNGELKRDWVFESDWKPAIARVAVWEPLFYAAVFGDFLYVPGFSGSVHKVDRKTGRAVLRFRPFEEDENTFVVSPITIDPTGNVFFTVLQIGLGDDGAGQRGFLVRVGADDSMKKVSYDELVPSAPAADALCSNFFSTRRYALPYPPVLADGGFAPTVKHACGAQRPGINAAPAVGPDGTIYTVTRAADSSVTGYVVAVTPSLEPKWARSLRGLVADGCGVSLPSNAVCPAADRGTRGRSHCCAGATTGVDPYTNELPAGEVSDQSTSSPVVLPDGTVLYGSKTFYNRSRGHLFRFSTSGEVIGSYDFGWDMTPAVVSHDGTFSVVLKDNTYPLGDGIEGPFAITRLSSALNIESQFVNTTSTFLHPTGFEWCVNALAVDSKGIAIANNADGTLYAVKPDGTLRDTRAFGSTWAAAYTPVTIDAAGRVYSFSGGVLHVTGR